MRALRIALLSVAVPLLAQDESAIIFRIQFANGQTRFHVGETIPVKLSFSSAAAGIFDLSLRDYDRSGRLESDRFHVIPEGRDPLRTYFSSGVRMFGGLMAVPRGLTLEPQTVQEDLNEWVALDRPGHYTLSVTSYRVGRKGGPYDPPFQPQSNALEFDIVAADPLWQRETLAAAAAVLERAAATDPAGLAAVRTLRFLDSEDSVRELVHRLGTLPDQWTWEAMAGLLGSAHPEFVIENMESQLTAPDTAVSADYVHALTGLELPGAWGKASIALEEALYRRAAQSIASKRGLARSETVFTLLWCPVKLELPGQEIADAFMGLPPEHQERMLSLYGERIRVPEMLSPLKKLAELPAGLDSTMRDAVFSTLYEIDPVEGRRMIIEEIHHPRFNAGGLAAVRAITLGMLPEKTLPELNNLLLSRLETESYPGTDLDAALLGRYATKEVLVRAKAAYENRASEWDCAAKDGFLLYFLRTNADYGIKQVKHQPSACLQNSLPAVIQMNRWNDVEPSIIRQLSGPDLYRAGQAAETLSKFGGRTAEAALWARLRRLNNEHKEGGSGLQLSLVEALGQAKGWKLSAQEKADLEQITPAFP